jgi:hypothetical protein
MPQCTPTYHNIKKGNDIQSVTLTLKMEDVSSGIADRLTESLTDQDGPSWERRFKCFSLIGAGLLNKIVPGDACRLSIPWGSISRDLHCYHSDTQCAHP